MSGIGRTRSIMLAGLRGEVVHVEADIAQSLPGFTLLGLPDQALQESRDRIRSAARNAGLPLTRRHLTVNLLPAGVHKRGACHDLAIVLAAYAADGRVRNVEGPVFLAELGLDGALHRSPETVAMVMAAVDAGCSEVVVAEDAEAEARLVPGAEVRGFAHLHDVIRAFGGEPDGEAPRRPTRRQVTAPEPEPARAVPDLAEVVLPEDGGDRPDRVDRTRLALVGGRRDRRVALDVFDAAHARPVGAHDFGNGLVALEIHEVLIPLARLALLRGHEPHGAHGGAVKGKCGSDACLGHLALQVPGVEALRFGGSFAGFDAHAMTDVERG